MTQRQRAQLTRRRDALATAASILNDMRRPGAGYCLSAAEEITAELEADQP